MNQVLLLLHAGATLWMVGLIWFVQIVHYPLMAKVGAEQWLAYERAHQQRTTLVVGPPMLIELISALALVVQAPSPLLWVGLGLVVVNWVSTACIQVPCHQRLDRGFDPKVHRRLVTSNWIRTIAWSGRGAIALLLLNPSGTTGPLG